MWQIELDTHGTDKKRYISNILGLKIGIGRTI